MEAENAPETIETVVAENAPEILGSTTSEVVEQ
jgi:hypothetical protein